MMKISKEDLALGQVYGRIDWERNSTGCYMDREREFWVLREISDNHIYISRIVDGEMLKIATKFRIDDFVEKCNCELFHFRLSEEHKYFI